MRPLCLLTTAALMLQAPRAVHVRTVKSGANRRKRIRDRFRRAIQVVMVAKYWIKCGISPKLSPKENILFFLDIPTVQQDAGSSVERDAILLKINPKKGAIRSAKDEHSVATIAGQILGTPSAYRTDDQVHKLVQALQAFSKFSGYPAPVQSRICKLGWYARFEPSRIMVRQQQTAEIYYFLLSGIAISREVEDQVDPGETRRRGQRAIFLRKGDTIGEKEILHNIKREVTVVSKEQVEVLGMDKEDFLETFKMVMGDKLDFLPFLKTVGELTVFPLELLQAHHNATSVQNYKKGAVITRNSKDADWVFIIKKGKCQVFQSLPSRSRDNASRKRTPSNLVPPEQEMEISVTSGRLPAISPAKSNTELTVPKPQYGQRGTDSYSRRGPRRSVSDSHLPRLVLGSNLVTQRPSGEPDQPTSTHSDDESGYLALKKKHTKSGSFPPPGLGQDDMVSPGNYACLETLTKGATFGLQTLIYEDGPMLLLVSQGSECIMVSKRFLRDHLDSTTLNKLRNKVPPYSSVGKVHEIRGELPKPSVEKNVVQDQPDDRKPWDNNYKKPTPIKSKSS